MKTILVVDDEADVIEALTEFLVGEGYRVVSATSSTDGLRQLVKERPDLALVDSIMPVVDGLGFVKRVHALSEFHSLPLIIMSASPAHAALAVETIGVSAAFKKPFELDELLAVIERLTGKGEGGRA